MISRELAQPRAYLFDDFRTSLKRGGRWTGAALVFVLFSSNFFSIHLFIQRSGICILHHVKALKNWTRLWGNLYSCIQYYICTCQIFETQNVPCVLSTVLIYSHYLLHRFFFAWSHHMIPAFPNRGEPWFLVGREKGALASVILVILGAEWIFC